MDRYSRYLIAVIAYMATIIIISILAVMYFCNIEPVDSFYYVIQTVWTIGYGDIVLPGDEGMLVSTAIMLFGIVGITSALGVIGAMILNKYTSRHMKIESEIFASSERRMAALYEWGERKGIDPEEISAALTEVDNDKQR